MLDAWRHGRGLGSTGRVGGVGVVGVVAVGRIHDDGNVRSAFCYVVTVVQDIRVRDMMTWGSQHQTRVGRKH
jgi:hypothetical protein